jgi:hypothetical protein
MAPTLRLGKEHVAHADRHCDAFRDERVRDAVRLRLVRQSRDLGNAPRETIAVLPVIARDQDRLKIARCAIVRLRRNTMRATVRQGDRQPSGHRLSPHPA